MTDKVSITPAGPILTPRQARLREIRGKRIEALRHGQVYCVRGDHFVDKVNSSNRCSACNVAQVVEWQQKNPALRAEHQRRYIQRKKAETSATSPH